MCPFIGLALALSVRLIEGAPGCHWDHLAPIFLQQEEEGARTWSFTLGEPSTVPDVLGLEQNIRKALQNPKKSRIKTDVYALDSKIQ